MAPNLLVYDGLMLPLVNLVPMADLADVKRVLQQAVKLTPGEETATHHFARLLGVALAGKAQPVGSCFQGADTFDLQIGVIEPVDRLGFRFIDNQLPVLEIVPYGRGTILNFVFGVI